MGTHPIFESDFDCLTDLEKNNDRPMNENDAENNTRNEPNNEEEAPPTPPQGSNNQRSTGDIILQVHIANIFLTFCQRYACLCNRKMRRGLEFIVLLKGIGAMIALVYAHVGYPLSATCLEPLKGKIPVESILRVEVGQRSSDLLTPYLEKHFHQIAQTCSDEGYDPLDEEFVPANATQLRQQQMDLFESKFIRDVDIISPYTFKPIVQSSNVSTNFIDIFAVINSRLINPLVQMHDMSWSNAYRFEFSHEFGYLRLSDAARKKRKVEVITVVLDPYRDECFGSAVSRALLIEWFGYESIILDSIVGVSGNRGFVRNTQTGEQFTVRSGFSKKKTIFIPIIACMAFTAAIAMLLRFAYKQVFMFVFRVLTSGLIDIWTLHNNFPYGAVATSVLALIGLEDIMSEYFSDSRIAFYVILNVWIADQFHSYCCHTPITKKYWLRFFYLYHLAFYVYYHIYSRRNAFMALFVSCILTMHMMLYFFHHFELPFVLNTFQIRMRINNENVRISQNQAQSNRGASANGAHSGVGSVEEETADQLNDQNVNGENDIEEDFHQVELHISDLDDEMEEILSDEVDIIL